jgi:hypothetical protein
VDEEDTVLILDLGQASEPDLTTLERAIMEFGFRNFYYSGSKMGDAREFGSAMKEPELICREDDLRHALSPQLLEYLALFICEFGLLHLVAEKLAKV